MAPRKLLEGANLLSRIFFWVGGEHYIRARVNWVDFYAKKEVGGLGVIDPVEKPMVALPCKWGGDGIGTWRIKSQNPTMLQTLGPLQAFLPKELDP